LTQSEEFRSIDPQLYTVPEFCETHKISRAYFYQLRKRGSGPQILKLGRRTLISGEAAAEWRRLLPAQALLAS
jgi:predicted DNA-binding transcriptional regulator AlpA